MTSTTTPAAGFDYGKCLADLAIAALLLCWGVGTPGFVLAALNAAPLWGTATAAQEHQVVVYLVAASAVSLTAPVIGLGVALWNERRSASFAFCVALALSIAGNAWLAAATQRSWF